MNQSLIKSQKDDLYFRQLHSSCFPKEKKSHGRRNNSLKQAYIQGERIENRLYMPSKIDQTFNQMRMKEKFETLYHKVYQIELEEQFNNKNIDQDYYMRPYYNLWHQKLSTVNYLKRMQELSRQSRATKTKSIITQRDQQLYKERLLEINIGGSKDINYRQPKSSKFIMRKSQPRPKLITIKKSAFSNRISDFISVSKITINDLEQEVVNNTIQSPSTINHLKISIKNQSPLKKASQTQKVPFRIAKKKFVPPFETYYYRDLVWRIGFSNQMVVQFPQQYDFKVKFYIGKGNNSHLIKGIINRRPWYYLTQKLEDAHFLWTQIKVNSFMELQKPNQKNIVKKQISYNDENILTQQQNARFQKYVKQHLVDECRIKEDMNLRNRLFKIKVKKIREFQTTKIHNHFKNNYVIGNKKALFHTMSNYYKSIGQDIFQNLPLTFHIKNGLQDEQYTTFLKYYYKQANLIKRQEGTSSSRNVWIVKPGEFSNRGTGIIVCLTLEEVRNILKNRQRYSDGSYKTFIVQKYIERPLLYKRRKFDLRHYMMVSCLNGVTKGYWYREGYVRTTSSEYTLKVSSGNIHLTNDAVQKHLSDYGKYEKGNKLSYEELNTYISKINKKKNFYDHIYPKMKKIGTDTIRACGHVIQPNKKKSFEIFGLDFMIDQQFNVWLIQVNTNPCLELSCPLLGLIIPRMVENVFQITLDSVFPPPCDFNPKCKIFKRKLTEENLFELVYDERQESRAIRNTQPLQALIDRDLQQEEDDVFEDDGEDWRDD